MTDEELLMDTIKNINSVYLKLNYIIIYERNYDITFFEKKPNKIWTIGKKSLPLHTLLEKSADKAVRMRK